MWKDIDGYEGLYQVSDTGEVRSLNYNHSGKIKVLTPSKTPNGYLIVGLWKNGVVKYFSIHRLVASTFLENPDKLPQVNHKDENKTNNRVENLEFCDGKYNINYGSCINRRSSKTRNGKLSKPILQFTKSGEFIRVWDSISECDRNGFNKSAIWQCCSGKTRLRTYKGFIWKYKKEVV